MVVYWIKRFFVCLVLFFAVTQLFAQEQNYFVVTGRITTDDGRTDGATIQVIKNDTETEIVTPPRTGRFRFEFEYNNEYELSFQKDGFFKKIIVISSHVPQEVWERNNEFPPFSFIVNLFKALPGIDKSFTNKPVGRVFYNASIDNFDSEIYFSDIQIEEQIEEAIIQNNELSAEQREINRANDADMETREKEYDKAIKEANAMYQQQQLDGALEKYTYAGELFPDRPYPKDRVAELNDLIAAKKLADQRLAEQMAKYQDAIDQADDLFDNQQYDQAKQIYQNALEIKPGDEYAAGRVSESDQRYQQLQIDQQYNDLIAQADQLFQSANFQEARDKYVEAAALKPGEEAYAQSQIAKIDEEIQRTQELAALEQQYQEAMNRGETAFRSQDYNQALVSYRKAADLKQDDSTAKERVAQVEGIILQNENQENYNKHIQDADAAFNSGDLASAKSLYEEALTHLPTETYPSEQIAEIDRRVEQDADFEMLMNLANERFQAGDWAQSRSLYEDARKIRDDEQISNRISEIDRLIAEKELNDRYVGLIQNADDQFVAGQYEQAKSSYQQASELNPDEQYPKDQLSKIDEELARLAEIAQKEALYQSAMQEGSQAFGSGQYQAALGAYQRALANKENDPVAQERITETENMISLQETRSRYDEQIARADDAFEAEDWENAKSLYQQAIAILPDESYPQERISQIDQIVERNNQFDQYVAQAQQAFSAEDYQLAKDLYHQAYDIKSQVNLTDRIAEIDQIIEQKAEEQRLEQERLAALDQDYQEAINRGNDLLTENSFDDARAAYQEAKQLKPEETLPDELINRANSLQAEYEQQIAEEKAREEARLFAIQQEKDQNYNRAVQMGDSLFAASQLELAKVQFESATEIKPEETYPVEQLKLVEERIQELARLNASYNEAIEAANQFERQNEYEQAVARFQEALQYRPEEEYPKNQIARLTDLIVKREAAEQLENEYQSEIQAGDSLFALNEFDNSKARFVKASELKPNESYPRSKIREIDAAMNQLAEEQARQQAIDESYQEAIQMADQAFSQNDYPNAKSNYNEALRIKPEETYPKDQIAIIDQRIQQQIEDSFNEALARADRLFAEENYRDSRIAYNEALAIKPADQHSSNQIAKIDQLLQQLARQQQEQEEQERSYQEKMQLGEMAFNSSQYQNAKTAYQEALVLKPEELLPAQQIEKIDSLLAELQRQEEINQLYSQAIQDGQNAYRQNQLPEAISFYQQALTHKPDEPMPKQRIAEIESMIAQQEEIERLAQMEEEQRMARLKARQDKYYAAIASGDQAYNADQLGQAREFYTQALDAMPDEEYAKTQIAEIDRVIEERAVAEMQQKQQAFQDSLRAAQEEAFGLKMDQAEQYVTEKAFDNAIAEFQAAIQILPDRRSEVNDRISYVQELKRNLQDQQANYDDAIARGDEFYQNRNLQNSVSAYEEALQYKPNENYPAERIRYIQSVIQTKEANYTAAISEADKYFETQDWFNAKDKYTEALSIKNDESYPSQQLVIVNQNIQEMQEAQKALEMTEESYKEAIASGEQALLNDQLSASLMHFEFAKELKPNETYPDVKIKEIQDLIAQRKQAEELAQQQAMVDDQYRQMISQADNSFKQESYTVAKTQYNLALSIKPEEDYPQNQIAIIDQILADRENVVVPAQVETPAIINQPVAEPVATQNSPTIEYTPVVRTSEYDNSLRLADQAYAQKDYTVAQFYYFKALKEQPNSSYANSRIREIATLIDQTMLATELTAYKEAVNKADIEFANKNYSIARFYYYKALEIKSWEQYPKDRVEEIRVLTNSRLTQREEEEYRDLIAKADEAYFKKELAVARSYYTQSLSIKKDERYPQIKLKDIDKLVEQQFKNEENQQYLDVVAEADKALYANNYSIARFYYNKALGLKPNEKYPKEQLQKIKELILNKQ
ncbi:hypothetical protein ACUNWD_01500 [Sunxiuqinia sp. A32]|uniref:hypothetical protein n=1 Tax=Sunxiuqinia sp. A32 TaxID=3461496 RepID=UPI004045CE22